MRERDRVFFPDLDGLRAIAAFAVILYHACGYLSFPETATWDRLRYVLSFAGRGGFLGVGFFFVLSGFLITFLMLEERQRTGRSHVGRFYVRRVLRIWPLYFTTLAVALLLCHPLNSSGFATGWMYVLFLANFDHILHGSAGCGVLGVQWSVCVEEQFYLLWPLFFMVFGRRRAFPWAMLAVGIGSMWFTHSAANNTVSDFHLFANMRLLVCGGMLAWGAHRWGTIWKRTLTSVPAALHTIVYLLGTALLFCTPLVPSGPLRTTMMYEVPMFFFLYVIAHQTHAPVSFLHLRNIPLLSWLGKISYGLYLTHMIVIHFVMQWFAGRPDLGWLAALLTLALTVLVSHFSYRCFESPFLRLKDRFSLGQERS